jgi:large subunit ribosomal protein L9
MAMQIILKKDVANLGHADEIVKVKAGYAINYLIPQGYAISATPSAIKQYEETVRQRAHKEAKLVEEANKRAAAIAAAKVVVAVKVSESGKIFGSVTTAQLADALIACGVDVDKKDIVIVSEGIKEPGVYDASVKCYKDVKGEFKFEVVAE